MADEIVMDASVAAKLFIEEPGSQAAEALVRSGIRLVAPELVLSELAHVAVKRFRRGDIDRATGQRMAELAAGLFYELASAVGLSTRVYALALENGLSAYDALYVALAEARGCALVTADAPLRAKIAASGLPIDVRLL